MPFAYLSEFREMMLDQIRAGRPVAEMACEREMHRSTLHRWKRQDRIDRGLVSGISTSESAELQIGARHQFAVGLCDLPGEAVGRIGAQPVVGDELETSRRLARRSACHCAVDARYSSRYVRVDALRRNSREIVDGDRPSRRAIARTPVPWPCAIAISSRSAQDRYRPDTGAKQIGGIPPA